MDAFRITGGVRLAGSVAASGSKNAALPVMAAAILAQGPVELQNVPRLDDVTTLSKVLETLGVRTERQSSGDLRLKTVDTAKVTAEYDLVRRMRAAFCVLGPLLARRGMAVVSLPGGCAIGSRPVDLHLKGLEALGANIRVERGYVLADATRLRGTHIHLAGVHGPTVTGTANVMSAATLAEGTTVITGAATEPEIVDLGHFLISMGARIDGLGSGTITIVGVDQLNGTKHRIIPDRIEAGTLLIAAAITGGCVTVQNIIPEHLCGVLSVLEQAGMSVEVGEGSILLTGSNRILPLDLVAESFPGVPTDLQAQFMSLLCLADGRSHIVDTVFPERFMHVAELNRLGSKVTRSSNGAMIDGVRSLTGADIMASDLRASAALVLAGLAASGETVIRRIYHLDRGYEQFDKKLRSLGAIVKRIREPLDRRLAD